VRGNPISYRDPLGLWTLQLGLGGSVTTPWGGSLYLSVGVAVDGFGNIGFYETGGPGVGIGLGESYGGTVQYSPNAQTINDLSGPFATVSAGLGAGIGGTVDAFTGTTDDGRNVSGFGFTIGEGLGVTSFDGVTYTGVQPIGKTNACGSH
jgi:hypothetical protein